jgi:hypothetical protein
LPEWWTGRGSDEAGQALDTASQALLMIQDKDVVKSQLIDMTAEVATSLGASDSRARDYLDTLQKLSDDTHKPSCLPAGPSCGPFARSVRAPTLPRKGMLVRTAIR